MNCISKMGLLSYLRYKWYADCFVRVAKKMDNLILSKKFDIEKSRKLLEDYEQLIKNTRENPDITGKNRNSLDVKISYNYEPSQLNLILRTNFEGKRKK